MATRVEREKRRATRLRKTSKIKRELEELLMEKDSEPEPEPEEDEDDDDVGVPVVKEKIEKDMGYAEYDDGNYIPGPTSWDEHDAMETTRNTAQQVREVTYTVQDLVSNIVVSNMSADEKSKAIKAVGDGLGARLKSVESEVPMKKELDLDLLEVEAVIAKDSRHLSISEKVADWFTKAKLTASAENALSDSDFALVVMRGGVKVRKYPIHDKSHIRAALSRAAQMMKRGGEAASDAKAALPKIHAAAKKMGIGTMEKSVSAVVVEKDATGQWRAVLWPTNNFIDLDSEILSEKAHIEYIEWLNKNMHLAPVFETWHIPGTARQNQMDFAGYESGHVVMSCPLTEKEAGELLKAQTVADLGLSHGSIVLERDPKDKRVITKYRMVEVSDLPLENAANPFTGIQTVIIKEADMKVKDYLVSVFGEEKGNAYFDKLSNTQKMLKEADVESKEKKEVPAVIETVIETKTETVSVEAIAKQVFERVSKELDIEGLSAYLTVLQENSEKVAVLEALVKELSGDQEEKLAKMIEAPAAKTLIWQKARASQSKETVLKKDDKDDEKLRKAKPEVGWLSELSGTAPIQS